MSVTGDATQDEIKRACRKLARKYHPDVSREPDAGKHFKEAGEACEVPKDPEKRAACDRSLRTGRPGRNSGHRRTGVGGSGFGGRFNGLPCRGLQRFLRGPVRQRQFCAWCRPKGYSSPWMRAIEPRGRDPARWRFQGVSVRRVRCVVRLERGLGVNVAGAALALNLLEELEMLRAAPAARG